MPEKKFEPVSYVSTAAKRTISVPDESTIEKIRGKDVLRTLPQAPISFVEGRFKATTPRQVEIIESQPDFGTRLGGWTTITRVPSEAELKVARAAATKDQIKKAQAELAKLEKEIAPEEEAAPAEPVRRRPVTRKKTAAKKKTAKKE